jgi:phospholipid/cholesterol/gamma-HCH transport system ATP-binding protein
MILKRERIKTIELHNVGYIFSDGIKIFNGINKKIELGQTLALTGESGLGKSILLKIIAGIIEPTSGKIIYNETPINKVSFETWIPLKLSTAFCFDNGGLLMNKSIEENLKLSLLYHNQWRSERSQKLFDQLVDDFKLRKYLHLRPAQVPATVRKQSGIVRAFLSNAQILFFDDPTQSLGEEDVNILKHWIERFRKESLSDAAILMATNHKKIISELHCNEWKLSESNGDWVSKKVAS